MGTVWRRREWEIGFRTQTDDQMMLWIKEVSTWKLGELSRQENSGLTERSDVRSVVEEGAICMLRRRHNSGRLPCVPLFVGVGTRKKPNVTLVPYLTQGRRNNVSVAMERKVR